METPITPTLKPFFLLCANIPLACPKNTNGEAENMLENSCCFDFIHI